MKTLCALLLLWAWTLQAQSTNAPGTNTVAVGVRAPIIHLQTPSTAFSAPFLLRQAKPNEVITAKHTYQGALVEAFKTRRPLQLVNPLAGPQYGSPEDNVARNPINHRILGIKLFAFSF